MTFTIQTPLLLVMMLGVLTVVLVVSSLADKRAREAEWRQIAQERQRDLEQIAQARQRNLEQNQRIDAWALDVTARVRDLDEREGQLTERERHLSERMRDLNEAEHELASDDEYAPDDEYGEVIDEVNLDDGDDLDDEYGAVVDEDELDDLGDEEEAQEDVTPPAEEARAPRPRPDPKATPIAGRLARSLGEARRSSRSRAVGDRGDSDS